MASGRTCTSKTWIESQQPLIFLEPSPTGPKINSNAQHHIKLTLLDENNACKAVVQVPEINARDTALVIELAISVEGLVCLDFQLAEAWRWRGAILKGWLVGV